MQQVLIMAAALLLAAAPVAGAADPFDDFISPVSSPTNFEDPRPLSEIRPIYFYQRISDDFGNSLGINGGDAHVFIVQARAALSERFAIVLNKSGYAWIRPDDEVFGTFENDNGWTNWAFGAKYAVYRDPERRAMLTFGVRYETPWGEHDIAQGRGSGLINPSLSALWGINDLHLMAYAGPRVAIDGNDSTFFDMSVHADYKLWAFYPLLEFNWVQTLDGGRTTPISQEGFDYFNFGSSGAGGRGVVTAAAGARWKILEQIGMTGGHLAGVDLGVAWETPVTEREDFFGWRVTTDVALRFQ